MIATFSRAYLKNHPRFLEKTYFIQKIWKACDILGVKTYDFLDPFLDEDSQLYQDFKEDYKPKWHTIRKGYRWEIGHSMKTRVWKSTPYMSKQVALSDDLYIHNVQNIRITPEGILVDAATRNEHLIKNEDMEEMAINDGFDNAGDLLGWLNMGKEYKGQLVIWHPELKY